VSCAIMSDSTVPPESTDHADACLTIYQDMTYRAPHKGTVYDKGTHVQKAKDGKNAYELLLDHYLGPNNVVSMASAAETKLSSTLYNGEKKSFTWEMYVRTRMEQHAVLNLLKEYGYSGINDCYKVCHLMKGIKTTELDVCKANTLASPTLHDNFTATVELY
jgi:hypothetical protein